MTASSQTARGKRIVILCEGDTEELAIRFFVARQWKADGLLAIGLQTINLDSKLEQIGVKTPLFLNEQEVQGVFTLVDLYGMNRVHHDSDDSLDSKVLRVREWLRGLVVHHRSCDFFPHVAVHETEAWILADGFALAERLGDRSIRAEVNAESKNFEAPPSKRVNDLFLRNRSRNRYHKISDGRPLFSKLEFDQVYGVCRYFRAFYDDLKSVGRRAI